MRTAGRSWTAAVAARRELEESSRKAAGSPEMLGVLLPLPGRGLAVLHVPFLPIPSVLGQALCRPSLSDVLWDLPCLGCACNGSLALKEREKKWKLLGCRRKRIIQLFPYAFITETCFGILAQPGVKTTGEWVFLSNGFPSQPLVL